jgi:hypothetical protein
VGIFIALLGALGGIVALLQYLDKNEPPHDVVMYRQEVLAACQSFQTGSNSLLEAANNDGTFDRDRLIVGLRDQLRASRDVLDDLWSVQPPQDLADSAREARRAANELIARTPKEIDDAQAEPLRLTIQQVAVIVRRFDTATRSAAAHFESTMTELAGEPCRAPAQPSGP